MAEINRSTYSWVQDGRSNYTEFAAMMRKGNPEAANPKKRRDVVL
jgi:calcium-dependent protein kinase